MNAHALPLSAIAHVIPLPRTMPSVLGMGAYLKASLCLIDADKAYVTRPAGDLGNLEAVDNYQAMLTALWSRADVTCAAHDLHPDFHSTRAAVNLGVKTLPVQHHHAHILATAFEHHHTGPVLGLSLDGFGLGPDNDAWGGELLAVEGVQYNRLGHLRKLPQPGGDIAAREPWRMGAAALFTLGRGEEIVNRYPAQPHAAMLAEMLARGVNCKPTSSCGRLFDAACGLLNVLPVSEFEGQAPMLLESMADAPEIMPEGWQINGGVLDFTPLLAALAGMDAYAGANLFHGTLAAGLADWVLHIGRDNGFSTLALGGGCFLNRVMTGMLTDTLRENGMNVMQPLALSAGDAGLSFGQAIAAALHIEQML